MRASVMREDPCTTISRSSRSTIVFFVLAGLLTVVCDRIIGPDPVYDEDEMETTDEPVAA